MQQLWEGKQRRLDWEIPGTLLIVCDFHLFLGKSQNKTHMKVEKNNLAGLPGRKGVEDTSPILAPWRITQAVLSQLSSKWTTVCPFFLLLPISSLPAPLSLGQSLNMTLHELCLHKHDLSLGNYLQANHTSMKPRTHKCNLTVGLWTR